MVESAIAERIAARARNWTIWKTLAKQLEEVRAEHDELATVAERR
jgi:hypothetical protein